MGVATGTAYANQKKIVKLSTGRLVVVVKDSDVPSAAFRYSDDGLTWTDYTGIIGWDNGSIHAYVDSGGTERLVAVWKQFGTGGGRTTAQIYGNIGTFDSGRNVITWGTASVISTNTGYDYPDVVVNAESTGGAAHVVLSFANSGPSNFASYFKATIDSSGVITAVSSTLDIGGSYSINSHTKPSITIDASKNLYAAWSAGGTGAGKGIRFKKASYSAGTWTWGTEREIDNAEYFLNANYWLVCRYDATNSMVMIGGFFYDGTNNDVMLYQRDAADTTTTTYTLFNNAAAADRITYGGMAVGVTGDVYLFGREESVGTGLQYVKWTRTSSTTGTIGSYIYLDDVEYNTVYSNVHYVQPYLYILYTVGNSPYTTKFDRLTIDAVDVAISATLMTATASMAVPWINSAIIEAPTATATATAIAPTHSHGSTISVPVATATAAQFKTTTVTMVIVSNHSTASLVPTLTGAPGVPGSVTLAHQPTLSVTDTMVMKGEAILAEVPSLSVRNLILLPEPGTIVAEIEDITQTVYPRVTMTWATSKFMDDLVITTSNDGVTSTDVPAANTHFIPAQAGNGWKDSTFKWAVTDALDYDGNTIRCDDGWVSMDSLSSTGEEQTYEMGWWSKAISNGSGTYAVPQLLQFVFDDRIANFIRVTSSDIYGAINTYTVFYKNTSDVWIQVGGTHTLTGYRVEHDLGSELTIRGIKIIVATTRNVSDVARIQEFEPVYRSVVPADDIVSLNVNKVREQYDTTVPMGALAANTTSLTLSNTELLYNLDGADLSPYLVKDVEMEVELGWLLDDDITISYVYMGKFYSDDWEVSGDNMTTTVSGRDASKFLQDGDQLTFGYLLNDVFAGEGIRYLALTANIGNSKILILDQGNRFKYLFDKDVSVWESMTNIALADIGCFYFDDNENLVYVTHEYLYNNVGTPVHTLTDSTNIIDGSTPTNIQANKVTVKVQPSSTANIGKQGVWAANSNESLITSSLLSSIDALSSTVVLSLTDATAWRDSGFFKLDDEIIKYEARGSNTFSTLTRGVFNTVAAAHTAGALAREVREYNIDFDTVPVQSVDAPFITAERFDSKVDIIRFIRTAYTANVIVAANENTVVNEVVMLNGTHPSTQLPYEFLISGIPIAMPESKDKITEQTQTNNNAIRRYGKKEMTIENPFISEKAQAERIAKFLIQKFEDTAQIVTMETLCVPHLTMSDVIRIGAYAKLGIINKDYFLIESDISYDGGLQQQLTLKEIT